MKKFLALILALVMALSLVACGGGDKGGEKENDKTITDKVAMITDYGDITDQSFNQTTYEACKAFAEKNNVEFTYKKPAGDNTADRVAMIEQAIDEGYTVIVMPGFAFGGAIVAVQDEYPDVKFIALDVSQFDIEDNFYNHDENGNRTDLVDPSNEPHVAANVYACVYQEELCGYMAGYAAVKLGYEKLGFLGGMSVPAVQRYGYGYIQGADAAAKELDKKVEMNYVYGGLFFGNADITAVMDTWYAGGTQVVFACGGGIYTSAVDAAKKVEGAKVIGVDTDQAPVIAKYAEDADNSRTLTSAMKGLYPATFDTLTDVIINGNWEKYSGKVENLGLVSAENPELNYVQIPMETTQWGDGFTKDDYAAMVKDMVEGKITVSSDISAMPATTNVTVNDQGRIGG